MSTTSKMGEMCHLSYSKEWQHFNATHPEFADEIRNVRLDLCTNGFKSFGCSGRQFSSWPVILTPYNLPPWMCMKTPYMFLTVIAPGPNNPRQNIDIYLQPFIKELKILWIDGILTYDVYMRQTFCRRTTLMWTVSDFPANLMLSGWSNHGKNACPYCMSDSKAFYLRHSKKMC
jgi:tnp2 family transposase